MNTHTFPILRLLADGGFHSGEALGQRLKISRAAVWNSLQQAQDLGVEIYSVRGKGYKLAQEVDFLDARQILKTLGTDAQTFTLEILETCDSTNSLLMQRASNGAAHGTCLVTEIQANGRGRRGKTWVSGLGASLTFSLLWRFSNGASGLGGLSLAVGVALARALKALGAEGIALKWPNDVLYQNRKLAGILIELQGEMMGPSTAVIGIGLNVHLPEVTRQSIDQPVADMQEIKPVHRNDLLASLFKHLNAVLTQFEREGFAQLRDEWLALHAYQDKQVRLLLPSGEEQFGTVTGIAEDGALMVDSGQAMNRYSSAEVSLRGAT
ncbi:MAG: bifunctional biotin--[acetyl-CoA-carboxylase] ligase/biotin operon repressor BirA [Methylophilaceae bacterium]